MHGATLRAWPRAAMAVILAVGSAGTFADEPKPVPKPVAVTSKAAPAMPPNLPRRVQEITDAILAHHAEPPVRQQMILSAIEAVYIRIGRPTPPGLGRRASAVTTPEQLASFLAESWPRTVREPVTTEQLEVVFVRGLLRDVAGTPSLLTAKEAKADDQIAANRYVGIQVALGYSNEEKLAYFVKVLDGGPAQRAGIREGEWIEEIDGVSAANLPIRDVVEKLRGEEGTKVVVKVRRPGEKTSRTHTLTRGILPRATVEGVRRKLTSEDWDLLLDGPDRIGYLKPVEIAGSTPRELRRLAARLESEKARAVILDLRNLGGAANAHAAVLLADELLESGTIGKIQTSERIMTYEATPESLFRGLPIALLTDQNTSNIAEWLAAGLQDNRRVVVVGSPTASAAMIPTAPPSEPRGAAGRGGFRIGLGDCLVHSTVPIGDGAWALRLATGKLLRGDGRALDPAVDRRSDHIPTSEELRDALSRRGVQPDIPLAPRQTPEQEAETPRRRGGRPESQPSLPRTSPRNPDVRRPLPSPGAPAAGPASDPVVQRAVEHFRSSLGATANR